MEEKKYTIRIPPCHAYDVEGTESWLSDLAEEGLLLSKDGFFCGFAYFEKAQPQHMKYRLEAAQKPTGFWTEYDGWGPEEEALALSEEYGWEYVTNRGQFFVYRSREPGARELNTDPEVQALALQAVRKRQRGNIHLIIFWGILYPLLNAKGTFLLYMIQLGTLFSLFGIGLLLWNLGDAIAEAVHLHHLRKKLLNEGTIDHKKDWRKRATAYHIKNAANLLLILLWFILLLVKWSDGVMEKDTVELQDYTGDSPFATLADFAGTDHRAVGYNVFGYGNRVRQWSDLLSPVNYDWREIAEVTRADGTVLDGGLYLKYHETIHPLLARQLFREYIRYDKWGKSIWQDRDRFTPIPIPELPVDEAFAYYDEIHTPNIVLRRGSTLLHASFSQFGEKDPIPFEEWTQILALSLTGE